MQALDQAGANGDDGREEERELPNGISVCLLLIHY
jgi:hypothetical protein